MSQPPAFQLYARDWLMGTRELSPEARGIYIDLLCLAWDKDGIPAELDSLVPYLAVSKAKLKRIWPEIKDKFTAAEEGRLRNARQESQRQEMSEIRQRRADAGRRGGKAKAKQ